MAQIVMAYMRMARSICAALMVTEMMWFRVIKLSVESVACSADGAGVRRLVVNKAQQCFTDAHTPVSLAP